MTVTSGAPKRVALLGLGTVGAAVAARLLDEQWREVALSHGVQPATLVAVGVRDPGRARSIELPAAVERTDDLAGVVARPDIDVVVELLGGLAPAGELIGTALAGGKSVVTANKALLAQQGPALETAARASGAALRFEAAVAAGIPILAPLARDLAANRIERVRGIVNGTTNFILSAMTADGREYADVLAEAQRNGYAEADPSADVDGWDAAHKLVLLARMAFGRWLPLSAIGRQGITGVSRSAVAQAAEQGLAIKLVVSADAADRAWVEPCAVSRRSLLGSTDGVTNVVEVLGWPVGRVVFQGPGAGGDATSSAVLADLLALGRGEGSTWAALPLAAVADPDSAPAPPAGRADDGQRFAGFRLLAEG
jgi:homoserine dehydrogenase